MRNSDVTSCRECKQYITQLEDKVIQSTMGEPSTCIVNKPTCDAKSDEKPFKVINSDENPFKPMNKLSRSPPPVNPVPRGRPTNKDTVSRRARSISNYRDS